MRLLRAIIPLLITVIAVYLLDRPLGALPALGRLLDPVNGWAANAEPIGTYADAEMVLPLQKEVSIGFDEWLVPHIKAGNDHDLYFTQGYLHAYFRLWQMDMQARASLGRISEILGPKALAYDRGQRRKGMVYGAEHSLQAMESDPRTKLMMDAYTEGVNAYIHTLNYRKYPLEYKLMGFVPEDWTNIKSAALLKYMADDLTGYTEDIEQTLLRQLLSPEQLALFYPDRDNTSTPVIPAGTHFAPPSLAKLPVPSGDIWAKLGKVDFGVKEESDGKGSNNWAVSGQRTKSGAPILCNDPHLGLNLPSLWYEVQMTAPGVNVYGVSLPGAPGVIIGFNDSISWGFTNNYRDVKDFYALDPAPGDKNAYMFNGKPTAYTERLEHIKIKGQPEYIDRVRYTVHGPVEYDETFHGPGELKKPLALCWMAHRATNELMAIYMLNRAHTYLDYTDAIMHFECPGQNMVYADKAGNIALWGQGQFVNKWKGQGQYVMNGKDSSTMWKELIPMHENPHVLNPEQGFVSSANQTVTDSTYPYWYNGHFLELRAWRVNQVLAAAKGVTIQDMFALQNDTYSIIAANTLPIMLKHMGGQSDKYLDAVKKWDYRLGATSEAATIYQVWSQFLYTDMWKAMLKSDPVPLMPSAERTMQLMMQSDTSKTPALSQMHDMIVSSYKEAVDSFKKLEAGHGLEWYKVKNTTVRHLTKIPAFSYDQLAIGGWGNTVNAAKGNHGPSWRMVVQMGKEIEAYGVYPGGQSGNPGSKYYGTFIDNWTQGKYKRLSFIPGGGKSDAIKYTWLARLK